MEYENKSDLLHSLNTVMIWLFCITLMLLVLPLNKISPELAARVNDNQSLVYLALLIELSNFISQGIISLINKYKQRQALKSHHDMLERSVNELDFSEKALLREFVLQRKSSLHLPVSQPTVVSLTESGILKIMGQVDDNGCNEYMIAKEVRPFITYKAIGLSKSGMSEEQIEQMMNSRPAWARPDEKKARAAYRSSGTFKAKAA